MATVDRHDAQYPRLLRQLPDPPARLWVSPARADLAPFLQAPAIGIVGSRDCSLAAEAFVRRLAREVAVAGFVVVSGLARGIDAAAHTGALEGAGRTVAVLGCGLDVIYPRINRRLRETIAERGLLVGEYPPGTPPRKQNFPARNRIISGLCCGVVVVEAGERSGSLITARLALEQGREVFVVPGSPLDGRSRGSNALLQDGAALVQSARDVLDGLPWLSGWVQSSGGSLAKPERPRSMLEEHIDSGVRTLDRLVEATPFSVSDLQAELFRLEMAGRIQRLADGSYLLL